MAVKGKNEFKLLLRHVFDSDQGAKIGWKFLCEGEKDSIFAWKAEERCIRRVPQNFLPFPFSGMLLLTVQ
jgi:hypothetical protein